MPSPLSLKLELGIRLAEGDKTILDALATPTMTLGPRESLLVEGEACRSLYVLTSGWACRFKSLLGSRQITGFLVPGDHISVDATIAPKLDYGVCTLTPCDFAETPLKEVEALRKHSPRVGRALRWAELVDEAILREWLLGLGRRPAEKRMAHLFCELLVRLQSVRLAQPDSFGLPLSQTALGDALGLSPAHVNRSLQSLRARQMLSFERGFVAIANLEKLQKFAGFNPRYLQPSAGDEGDAIPALEAAEPVACS